MYDRNTASYQLVLNGNGDQGSLQHQYNLSLGGSCIEQPVLGSPVLALLR